MARAGRHFQFAFRGAPPDVPITVHTLCLFKYVMKLFHMECFRLPEGVLSGHLCAEAPRLSRKVVIKGNLAEMFNLTAVLPNKFGVRWADALWRGHCKPIKVRNVCVMARLGSSIWKGSINRQLPLKFTLSCEQLFKRSSSVCDYEGNVFCYVLRKIYSKLVSRFEILPNEPRNPCWLVAYANWDIFTN